MSKVEDVRTPKTEGKSSVVCVDLAAVRGALAAR